MIKAKPSPLRAVPTPPTSFHPVFKFNNQDLKTSKLQATASNWHPTTASTLISPDGLVECQNVNRKISGAVRFVNVRVAIPVETPPEEIQGYVESSLQLQQQNKDTVIESMVGITGIERCIPNCQRYGTSASYEIPKSIDTYNFVPISHRENGLISTYGMKSERQKYRDSSSPFSFRTASSPYSFGKSSPFSCLTVETSDMTETSCYSCSSTPVSSRMCSPAMISFLPSPPLCKNVQHHIPECIHPGNNISSSTSISEVLSNNNICKTVTTTTTVNARPNHNMIGHRSSCINNGRKFQAKMKVSVTNDVDDEDRKRKKKTEMCGYFLDGIVCPYGAKCDFAHGSGDQQKKPLMAQHEEGEKDLYTFRTKPCWTWVATGSCPFGIRCSFIHDPRVGSCHASCLTHTETQGNKIETDINVDALHQKRTNTIIHNNPFGIEELTPGLTRNSKDDAVTQQWNTLYDLVTDVNDKHNKEGWMADMKHRRSSQTLDPIVKLQIAIHIRDESTFDWHYKYRPQNSVHGEQCMILSKKAFRVVSHDSLGKRTYRKQKNSIHDNKEIDVVEIPISAYKPSNPNHMIVREIAFGPDNDPSVRGLALWFHIDENDVTELPPEQAQRARFKKGKTKSKPGKIAVHHDQGDGTTAQPFSIFDGSHVLESFPMIRPQDPDAYSLVSDILRHRLLSMKAERICNLKERFESLRSLRIQKDNLKNRFENLHRSWLAWAWPINFGREIVDPNTPEPPVDGLYNLPPTYTSSSARVFAIGKDKEISKDPLQASESEKSKIRLGVFVKKCWESLVSTIEQDEQFSIQESSSNLSNTGNRRQLKVFELLSHGCSINTNDDGRLPHILRDRAYLMDQSCWYNTNGHECQSPEYQHMKNVQKRCWIAILHEPTAETGLLKENEVGKLVLMSEWDVALKHFKKSKCTKVLKYVQQ